MQALLMNLTQTASAPLSPQVSATAIAEAQPGKEGMVFGDLLQALTSGVTEPEEVLAGGADQSEEERDAALDGLTEQAVLAWLQSLVGRQPVPNPEMAPVSLTAEESLLTAAESVVAGALPMQQAAPAVLEPSTGSLQIGGEALTKPESTSGEQTPLAVAKAMPELTPEEVSQPTPDPWQSAAQLSEEQPTEVPAVAEHLPEAASVPAWSRSRVDVFRQAHLHTRGAAVTAGSPTAITQASVTTLQNATQSMSRPWTLEPRIWQQAASNAQAAEQVIDRASVVFSQATAARTVQIVPNTVVARAVDLTVEAEISAEVPPTLSQSAAVVSAEHAPEQVAPLTDTVGAAVAQPMKSEQLPESGQSSREGVVAMSVAGLEAEALPEVVRPLILRDTESFQTVLPQNQVEAEVPRAESRLEPSTVVAPSKASVPAELKEEVNNVRPLHATRLALKAESGEADTRPDSSEPIGDSAEVTSVPSLSSQALRLSASSSDTVNLAADQLSKPSEQLQAALDAGIRQIKVSAEQKGEVTVKMQLYPEDLGEVRVNVRISEGAISAKFQAASQEAAQVIKESLANLRQALDGQGFSQVSLTAESFGSNLAQHSDRRSRRSPFRDERNQRQVGGIVAESAEASASRPLSGLSRLDYRF